MLLSNALPKVLLSILREISRSLIDPQITTKRQYSEIGKASKMLVASANNNGIQKLVKKKNYT